MKLGVTWKLPEPNSVEVSPYGNLAETWLVGGVVGVGKEWKRIPFSCHSETESFCPNVFHCFRAN